MARTAGARNADYDATRAALAVAVQPRLLEADGATASLRDLASVAGVSVATLKHYFGDRAGVLEAAFIELAKQGAPYILHLANGEFGDVGSSLRTLLRETIQAWTVFGIGAMHRLGLGAGLGHPRLGPAYVTHLLEPTLTLFESRIGRHVASGELERCDLRLAALGLVSPVFLALLHQDGLFGVRCRPLDLNVVAEDGVRNFLRLHGRPGPHASAAGDA